MTSTSTDFKPTIEDFDQWTEKNDEEAFASIAQNYKVRHIIKGDVYWALVPGGRTYKLPLSMSIDDFTRLSNTSDDTESVEQLKRILSAFAGDKQAKALNGEPVQVVFNLLSDYATLSCARREPHWENPMVLPPARRTWECDPSRFHGTWVESAGRSWRQAPLRRRDSAP